MILPWPFQLEQNIRTHVCYVSFLLQKERLSSPLKPGTRVSSQKMLPPFRGRPRPPLPSEVRDKRQRANECRWAHPAFQSSNEAKERDRAKPAQQSDKVGYCFTVGQSLRRTAQQNAERIASSTSLPSLAPPFETKTVLVGEGRRPKGESQGGISTAGIF